ncbi:hypothetical protein PspTeo4_01128 [Pseudomonas sp. Teo4]|nr:hypothetical protein [Pseudomonas sp. Teo4]
MFLRGWMGGLFLVVVLILCRTYPLRISLRRFGRLLLCLMVVLALLPVVIDAKWAMRSGKSVSDFVFGLSSIDVDSYFAAVRYIMNRFQHVGHVAIILENSSALLSSYLQGVFIPYWADGLPQMVAYKVFSADYLRLNSFLVEGVFGYQDAYWNTNPGLAGWAVILQERAVIFVLYLLLLLILIYYFLYKHAGRQYLMLVACFSLVYLYHGWMGAFFNLGLYALVLIVSVRARFTLHRRNVLEGDSDVWIFWVSFVREIY